MQIRIEASDLPGRSCGPGPDSPGGHHNIHVGVQRRKRRDELLGLVPGDAPSATWTLDCTAAVSPDGVDLKGPYIQGPPGGRFIYLSWGTVDDTQTFTLFRRAKLSFDAIPQAVIDSAQRLGMLVGRLGLTDAKGNPLCAAVRPPVIEWSAEARLAGPACSVTRRGNQSTGWLGGLHVGRGSLMPARTATIVMSKGSCR